MKPETPLIDVLNVLSERDVSAVPMVDANGVVMDIYSRRFVMYMADDKELSSLDVPVETVLKNIRSRGKLRQAALREAAAAAGASVGAIPGAPAFSLDDDEDCGLYVCTRFDTVHT